MDVVGHHIVGIAVARSVRDGAVVGITVQVVRHAFRVAVAVALNCIKDGVVVGICVHLVSDTIRVCIGAALDGVVDSVGIRVNVKASPMPSESTLPLLPQRY